MQKLYTRSRNPILQLLIASALLFTSFTAARGLLNPDWRNDWYFANVAKELVVRIRPGMSQAKVDAILGEYEDVFIEESSYPRGNRTFESAKEYVLYGEESNSAYYYSYRILLQGDPTNLGTISACSIYIYFEKDAFNEKEVDFISDRLGPGDCGYPNRG